MPVRVEKRGGKYRVVEPSGRLVTTPKGNARDGGGHTTRQAAQTQVNAINASRNRRKR